MAQDKKDFCKIAIDYAKEASDLRNRKRFGVWIRLAAIRFLKDLKRAEKKNSPFYFDEWHGNDVCDFAEKLPHIEGVWDSPYIVLHRSHIFFLVQLFGFRKQDGTRRFTTALFAIARKNAKALGLDTPIPTPDGWKTIEEIEAGDVVFGADGKPCNVLATSPVFENHKCYRLTFSNNETVVADAGHLWFTTARVDNPNGKKLGQNRSSRVRTTQEIADTLRYGKRNDINHSMVMPKALVCNEVELPIKPYTLGVWIADGHSDSGRVTFMPTEYEMIEGIKNDGYPLNPRNQKSKAITYGITDGDRSQVARDICFSSVLRANNLKNNKHIPDSYLRASYNQRLALLQGLMDADGTINKNGRVLSYTTISEKLANGVCELLASFGIKYTCIQREMKINGRKVNGLANVIQFMAFKDEIEVFRLKRKLDRMRLLSECSISPRSKTVQIVSCEEVDSVPVKCLSVDSQNNLFLFGRSMLPTHNSTLASIIGLYCQNCEGEIGPQVVTGATTGQQARIVFNVAKKMVEKVSDLRDAFNIKAFANSIVSYNNGGSFKPINSKASTQDGLNPSCVVLDEIHAHPNSDLINVLRSAAGARRNPLFLYLTTEGYTNLGPWAEEREMAKKILQGIVEADHYLAIYYCLDENNDELGTKEDDDFDESSWIKANPLMEVNPILLDSIRKEAIEAKEKPSVHSEFKIKRLNRPTSVSNGFINLSKWKECVKPVDLEWLKEYPCYGGLDLSSTTDLTSFRLVWNVEGVIYTHGWRWCPRIGVRRRKQRGLIPYQGWVDKGLLLESGNEAINYADIERVITDANERFMIQSIGYDSWNASQSVQRLNDAGVNMVQFIQGPKSYHPAMQALEVAYLQGNLAHGNDPILNWNASNLVSRQDVNLNNAPDKRKSSEKIDDMVSLLMGIGMSISEKEATPEYQMFFL